MKAAHIVSARNKERYVGACVDGVLAQTYSPMELIFSDQGSTDKTLEVIQEHCRDYKGSNTVRILQCPEVPPSGMSGLNTHINWLNKQTEADIIIQTSADDLDHPDRDKYVIEAYEKHNPAMVLTTQKFIADNPEATEILGITGFPIKDGFVTGVEDLHYMIGSSASVSWSREFYDRVGGIHGITCPDVYLAYLATQDRGLYFVYNDLHAYVRVDDPDNTGLEGVYRAAKTEEEKLQIEELMHFQITNTLREIALYCEVNYPNWNIDDRSALLQMMVGRCLSWAKTRCEMTFKGIQPLAMRP